MAEILDAIPPEITIAAYVAEKEALRIRGPVDYERIELEPLIVDGLITIVTLETELERETALSIAAAIRGQGEAETGAIAIHRNWCMAVDDKRARNFLAEQAKDVQIIYTLEIVKHWADSCSISEIELRNVLQNIRTGGSYLPRKSNPLYGWWNQFMP
ncbi:hypothetical protein KFU94_53760 [Chloroflexi bacterium TSY]|nr:hypothetical protein [Chloroflexi bacterium TSY]